MYETALILHSFLRWVAIAAGLVVVARAVAGLTSGRPWNPGDLKIAQVFLIALDVQLLVGLVLYGVASPFVASALANMGDAMRSSDLRFWAVEHPLMMVVSLIVAHVGFARLKRAGVAAPHRQALILLGLAWVLILAATPWPGTANERPLLRFW